jgi:hypothetical protein
MRQPIDTNGSQQSFLGDFMKKILALLAVALLTTGCFNKEETTATTDAANTEAAAPVAEVAPVDAAAEQQAAAPAEGAAETAPAEAAPVAQ